MASLGMLAAVLRGLRESGGLSVSEAARRADLPRTSLRNWESGRHAPPGDALERLLAVLNATPGERAAILAGADPRYAQDVLADSSLGPPIGRGAILRALRVRRRLTQGEVARAMGVTQASVAKWESAESVPSDQTLTRLVGVLGASPDEALTVRCAEETNDDLTIEAAYARGRALVLDPAWGSKEPLIIAHEAAAWRRAVRDNRWEPVLVHAMGLRAVWTQGVAGRPTEALVLARRALDLAARSGAWDACELAFGCLLDHAMSDSVSGLDGVVRAQRRSETIARRVSNPRTRASLLGHPGNLVAAESRTVGGLREVARRVEDALGEEAASACDTALDPRIFVNYQIVAYATLGRIDQVVELDEANDWSGLPDGGAWTRAVNLAIRMSAYNRHGVEPSADELRRFEAYQPIYEPVPTLRHEVRDWHKAHDARKRRRYA